MQIEREIEFDRQVLELTESYERMDFLDSNIDSTLRKKPTEIPNVLSLGNGFFLWVTEEFSPSLGIPAVRILYRYDGSETVTLISIQSIGLSQAVTFSNN